MNTNINVACSDLFSNRIKPQSELGTSGERLLGILNMFVIVFNGFRVNI